jgi:thiosulfate dehydrogenase
MNEQRDSTRARHPRVRLMVIALAMACGRGDAPAAAAPASATPPPRAQPSPDTSIPAGPMGVAVRRGHALLAATRDSLPSHVGSSLRCFSCHLDEGRRASALPLIGSYARYPQYRARRARVDLIEDRVNDCFLRSLNGRAIAIDGDDMRDIVAYLAWMSRGVPAVDSVGPQDVPSLATLNADTTRGARVFTESCVRCHGASGQGTMVAPPLWGPRSFNIGAGMARYRTAAQFIVHNMPFDRPGSLTLQQALDVARYVDSRPRPDFRGKERDWPKGGRPADAPYSTIRANRHPAATVIGRLAPIPRMCHIAAETVRPQSSHARTCAHNGAHRSAQDGSHE